MKNKNFIKLGFLSILVSVSLIYMVSCEKEKKISRENFNNPYEKIGIDHNNGMEYVFNDLKTELGKKSIPESKNEVFKLSENSVYNYLKNLSLNYQSSQEIVSIVFERMQKMNYTKSNSLISIDTLQLSVNQRIYVNEIVYILDTYDFATTISKISELEYDAYSKLSSDEAELVLSSAAIAKYSRMYWEENSTQWENLLNENNFPIEYLPGLVRADVVGGIVGALMTWEAGGSGTLPGACGASIAYCLDQLL